MAAISWCMCSVASSKREAASAATELVIFGDATGQGSATASKNSNWWECLPADLPVGIATRKGGFYESLGLHRANEGVMRQCGV
ncbi:hypothetical protein NDU88_003933 [Pleurodeles waltl]|uniref:Uncharacterized protein n=1 Tax=Pleurodeles waltl TaxID=8319 RepID=A0AAV7M4T7_PLEWA|nr:hypothetical protein NDU88_003933 [Pleurodeles waltl]